MPDKVPPLREKLRLLEKNLPLEEGKLEAMASWLSPSGSSVDQLVEKAKKTTDPRLQQELYLQAAHQASEKGDTELTLSLAEKIDEPQARQPLQTQAQDGPTGDDLRSAFESRSSALKHSSN